MCMCACARLSYIKHLWQKHVLEVVQPRNNVVTYFLMAVTSCSGLCGCVITLSADVREAMATVQLSALLFLSVSYVHLCSHEQPVLWKTCCATLFHAVCLWGNGYKDAQFSMVLLFEQLWMAEASSKLAKGLMRTEEEWPPGPLVKIPLWSPRRCKPVRKAVIYTHRYRKTQQDSEEKQIKRTKLKLVEIKMKSHHWLIKNWLKNIVDKGTKLK